MVRLVLLRFLQLLLTTWGLITLLFLFTRTLADEQQLIDRFSDGAMSSAITSAEQIQQAQQATRIRLGLADPIFYISSTPAGNHEFLAKRWRWNGVHNQYHQWLCHLVAGNLGRSYRTEEPVAALVGAALLISVPLTCLAALLIIGCSVALGLWLASYPKANWVRSVLYVLDSLPLFVLALFLLLLLANPDFLVLFPTYGLGLEEEMSGGFDAVLSQPFYLALPIISLLLSGLAEPSLQLADALQHEVQLDYILTAKAKGLSTRQVLWRHALRNALLPTITLFTELLPNLLAGTVVVELIFALPGLGRLLATAAAARDYPLLLGGVLVVLVVRQLTLALADWLYQLADPRLRLANQ